MPHIIHIHNCQKRIVVHATTLKKVISAVFNKEKIGNARLSIVIVTDRMIHALNKKFLAHDYPTDVITFDLSDADALQRSATVLEAEIYVSAVMAWNRAREFGCQPAEELMLYIVHGLLHLLGYDDGTPAAQQRMRKKEKEIMHFIMTNQRA